MSEDGPGVRKELGARMKGGSRAWSDNENYQKYRESGRW